MTIDQYHVEFQIRFNKLDSADGFDLHPAVVDMFTNEAIQIVTDQKSIGTALMRQLGDSFDAKQYLIDDLSTLRVLEANITAETAVNDKYRFDIDAAHADIMRFESAYFIVSECSDHFPCEPIEMDKLNQALTNTKLSPSLQWRRSVCTMHVDPDVSGNRSITVYSNGEYTPTNLYLTYLKKPATVALGGYTGLSGAVSKVEFDLPEQTHYNILELAVMLAHAALDNPNSFNIATRINRITNLQE